VCSARGAGAPQQERKTMKTLLFNLTFYPSINHSQPRSDGLFPPLVRPGTGLRWPPGYVGNRGRPAGLRHGTRGSRAATCVPQGAWWGRLSVQHSSSELPFETAAPFPDREESNGVAVQRRLFPEIALRSRSTRPLRPRFRRPAGRVEWVERVERGRTARRWRLRCCCQRTRTVDCWPLAAICGDLEGGTGSGPVSHERV
jgi:hypothetical protein